MKGADEYCRLFKQAERFGKLCVVPGSHARGDTFRIFVVPEAAEFPVDAPWQCRDAVEVYGIVSGNPGWTEEYDWLHEGKWQQHFEEICRRRKLEQEEERKQILIHRESAEQAAEKRVKILLERY